MVKASVMILNVSSESVFAKWVESRKTTNKFAKKIVEDFRAR